MIKFVIIYLSVSGITINLIIIILAFALLSLIHFHSLDLRISFQIMIRNYLTTIADTVLLFIRSEYLIRVQFFMRQKLELIFLWSNFCCLKLGVKMLLKLIEI